MKYIKENSELLTKYLLIILFNVIIYFLSSFYFKNLEYKSVIMTVIILISNIIIYYYKGTKKFKYLLDIIVCIISGLLIMPLVKNELEYSTILFSVFLADNIVFMSSRFSNKFLRRSLQYLGILGITVLCMVICLTVFLCFH